VHLWTRLGRCDRLTACAPERTAFDFQVGDLDSAVSEALALGATVADHQPQDNVRVLFDPAGHPFCLCRDDG
jgi:hypothetical protein